VSNFQNTKKFGIFTNIRNSKINDKFYNMQSDYQIKESKKVKPYRFLEASYYKRTCNFSLLQSLLKSSTILTYYCFC